MSGNKCCNHEISIGTSLHMNPHESGVEVARAEATRVAATVYSAKMPLSRAMLLPTGGDRHIANVSASVGSGSVGR